MINSNIIFVASNLLLLPLMSSLRRVHCNKTRWHNLNVIFLLNKIKPSNGYISWMKLPCSLSCIHIGQLNRFCWPISDIVQTAIYFSYPQSRLKIDANWMGNNDKFWSLLFIFLGKMIIDTMNISMWDVNSFWL